MQNAECRVARQGRGTDAAQQAIRIIFAEIIVVSMGACWCLAGCSKMKNTSARRLLQRNAQWGAGDMAMVAGIIYSIQQQKPLNEALAFGPCGTAATMNEGTQLFDKEDVLKLSGK